MKATILQENLSRNLQASSRFVSSRSQLPILSNVVMRAQNNRFMLLSTNLEMSFVCSIGANIEEEGEIAVPARTITDLISALTKGQIELKSEGEQLKITSENFESTLVGMNPSDFPIIPTAIKQPVNNIPRSDFSKALSQVLFATSNDETRPVLTGVLFVFDKKKLLLVGTDGFRLSQKTLALTKESDPFKLILPRSTLAELSRISATGDEIAINVNDKDNQVIFGLGPGGADSVLSSRIIEGEFPNYERIIPKDHSVSVQVDKQDLLSAVKASIVIARDSAYVGRVSVGEGYLEVSSESARSGKQKQRIDAKVTGDKIEVLFNLHFIEEFLTIMTGEVLHMELKDQTSPGVFNDATDPQFLHLIMPVKLS